MIQQRLLLYNFGTHSDTPFLRPKCTESNEMQLLATVNMKLNKSITLARKEKCDDKLLAYILLAAEKPRDVHYEERKGK